MLFGDMTDSEVLVFRTVQRAEKPVRLHEIIATLRDDYDTEWAQTTVCTFLKHLLEKGYLKKDTIGGISCYSLNVNGDRYIEVQTRKFIEFWYDGDTGRAMETVRRIEEKARG